MRYERLFYNHLGMAAEQLRKAFGIAWLALVHIEMHGYGHTRLGVNNALRSLINRVHGIGLPKRHQHQIAGNIGHFGRTLGVASMVEAQTVEFKHTRRRAALSEASLLGVPVPWAFT